MFQMSRERNREDSKGGRKDSNGENRIDMLPFRGKWARKGKKFQEDIQTSCSLPNSTP